MMLISMTALLVGNILSMPARQRGPYRVVTLKIMTPAKHATYAMKVASARIQKCVDSTSGRSA